MNRTLICSICLLMLTIWVDWTNAFKSEDQCLGEYEFWGCQSSTIECQRFCENRGTRSKRSRCKLDCQRACVCEAGYLRDGTDGECVYETECPQYNPETGKNDFSTPGPVQKSATSSTTKKVSIGAKLAQAKKANADKVRKPKRMADDSYPIKSEYFHDNNVRVKDTNDDDYEP